MSFREFGPLDISRSQTICNDASKLMRLFGFIYIAAHIGVKLAQNPNFGGRELRFQAKRAACQILKFVHVIAVTVKSVTIRGLHNVKYEINE